MTQATDNLAVAVTANTAAVQAAVTGLNTLAADLQTAISSGNDVAIQAAADAITANAKALSDAVAADVPAAPAPAAPAA